MHSVMCGILILWQTMRSTSFTGQYMAVRACAETAKTRPEQITGREIELLHQVLGQDIHAGQKCAPFLYQEAAMALSHLVSHCPKTDVRFQAGQILDAFTRRAAGSPCMAAARALGSLPVRIEPPAPPTARLERLQQTDLATLTRQAGLPNAQCRRAGRSLLFTERSVQSRVLVLKCAADEEQALSLINEAWWMEYLTGRKDRLLPGQHIPRPLYANGSPLCRVRLDSLPEGLPTPGEVTNPICLPYLTAPTYFSYAIDPDPNNRLTVHELLRVLGRAAFGLGRLSRQGIVHRAPIPLFHNRVQSGRRDDHGRYIWTRGGRLDRWFSSCLFPNFGLSGLRDFEHLEVWSGYPRHLFRDIGTQILSLVLVAGASFRLKDPQLMGLTGDNSPVDARHLFDRDQFQRLLRGVVREFSTGFLGRPLEHGFEGVSRVVDPLIEAMGVDRHMTEVFRAQDQLLLQPSALHAYVQAWGVSREQAQRIIPGREDVTLITGPHLGEFNSRISVPELIDFTASVAGLCLAEAYFDSPAH